MRQKSWIEKQSNKRREKQSYEQNNKGFPEIIYGQKVIEGEGELRDLPYEKELEGGEAEELD